MINMNASGGSQSWNYVAGAIFVAFVIYITAKGELPTYIQLLIYAPPANSSANGNAASNASSAAPSSSSTPSLGSVLSGTINGLSGSASALPSFSTILNFMSN